MRYREQIQQADTRIRTKEKIFLNLGAILMRVLRRGSLNLDRFVKSNSLEAMVDSGKFEPTVKVPTTLIIVSAPKDFDILPLTISLAHETQSQLVFNQTKVIVPEASIEALRSKIISFGFTNINVISEEEVITLELRNLMKRKFGPRYGWALQQFLKIYQVLDAQTEYSLVLDSDTLLLKSRYWLDSAGRQALFPSWEFHCNYYEILNRLGICSTEPEFTLITHHMFMKKENLLKALQVTSCKDPKDLLLLMNELALEGSSPFCIDYELYGQYMLNFQFNKVILQKWSNIEVERSIITKMTKSEILHKFANYCSLSAHSYLSAKHINK